MWLVDNLLGKPVVRTTHGEATLGATEISFSGPPRHRPDPQSLVPARAGTMGPPTVIWNRPQPLLEVQPWTADLRALGPLRYRRSALDGMLARYELADRIGRVLVTETRRYTRPHGPNQRNPITEWSIELQANPLPDEWLLGILLTTTRSRLAVPR